MNKNNRHQIIKNVILTNEIISQDMLLNILLEKGLTVTQATLSRDIKELRIVKSHTETGGYTYKLPENSVTIVNEEVSLSSIGFISIEFSGQLAVIKTRPGYAMAIAGEIDNKATNIILGTVAGDDTVLVIPRENIARKSVLETLALFIPNVNK